MQTTTFARLKQFGLRWVTLYVLFYLLFDDNVSGFLAVTPAGVGEPLVAWVHEVLFSFWSVIVPWVGAHVFGHQLQAAGTVDDRLFGYLEAGIVFVLATAVAGVWTYLDRTYQPERNIYEATRLLARYVLAAIMFSYGFDKTFHIQMPYPGPTLLMQPLGDLTADSLLWALVGQSTLYSFFAGFAEVAGGALLLFRRTSTLGALVIIGVMTNVALLDLSYNVSARFVASQYLLIAIFLVAADARRLANAILFYRPLTGVSLKSGWLKGRWVPVCTAVKILIILWMIVPTVLFQVSMANGGIAAQQLPMNGLYSVNHFQWSNPKQATNKGDTSTWERVAIEGHYPVFLSISNGSFAFSGGQTLTVRTATDAIENYSLRTYPVDKNHGRFKVTGCVAVGNPDYICAFQPDPSPTRNVLNYVVGTGGMELKGNVNGRLLSMRLTRVNTSDFLLERSSRVRIVEPDNTAWERQ